MKPLGDAVRSVAERLDNDVRANRLDTAVSAAGELIGAPAVRVVNRLAE